MGVGAGLSMYVVVVQKFTFAISSPDEFLLLTGIQHYSFPRTGVVRAGYRSVQTVRVNLEASHSNSILQDTHTMASLDSGVKDEGPGPRTHILWSPTQCEHL